MESLIQSIRKIIREEIDAALIRHFSPVDVAGDPIGEEIDSSPVKLFDVDRPISLYEHISILLNRFSIPSKLLGYHYIREAIEMAYFEPTISTKLTKQLYPEIAAKFNTTPSRVERAIRHAIEVAWNQNEEIHDVFRLTERPTNGEFISTITEHLRLGKGVQ